MHPKIYRRANKPVSGGTIIPEHLTVVLYMGKAVGIRTRAPSFK